MLFFRVHFEGNMQLNHHNIQIDQMAYRCMYVPLDAWMRQVTTTNICGMRFKVIRQCILWYTKTDQTALRCMNLYDTRMLKAMLYIRYPMPKIITTHYSQSFGGISHRTYVYIPHLSSFNFLDLFFVVGIYRCASLSALSLLISCFICSQEYNNKFLFCQNMFRSSLPSVSNMTGFCIKQEYLALTQFTRMYSSFFGL